MTGKIKCRICGEELGKAFMLEAALIHLLERHAALIEALATFILEETEEP
ncbi:MAG: hypothetical protein QW692_03540 [Nitrososphaerota archaeon]